MEHVSQILPRVCDAIDRAAVVTDKGSKTQWRTLLVLASSRKNSAFCVAGREWSQAGLGPWVRPVSCHGKGELGYGEIRMDSGQVARVGDVVMIPFGNAVPDGAQHENQAVLQNRVWKHVGLAGCEMLSALVESPAPLWSNGWHVQNDRVPEMEAMRFDYSLCLIRLKRLQLSFSKNKYGQIKARATFVHREEVYCLSVTDPDIEAMGQANVNQTLFLDDVLMCVSLAPAFNGYCYKLAATVITRDRLQRRLS